MSKRASCGVGSGGWMVMCRVGCGVWRVAALLSVGRRVSGIGEVGWRVRRWMVLGVVRSSVVIVLPWARGEGRRLARCVMIDVRVSVVGGGEEGEEGLWKTVAIRTGVVASMVLLIVVVVGVGRC